METEGCSSIDRLCLFVFFVEQGEFWRRSSCRYVVISFFISNRLGIESSDSLPLTPTDQLDCFHFFFIPSQMVRPIFPSERDDGERERERERKKIKETEREPKSRNDVLICRRPLALVAGLFSDKSHVERPRDDADFSFIHRRYPSKSFTTPFVGSSPLSLSLSLFSFSVSPALQFSYCSFTPHESKELLSILLRGCCDSGRSVCQCLCVYSDAPPLFCPPFPPPLHFGIALVLL